MNEKEIAKLKSQTILQIVIDEFIVRGLLNSNFNNKFGTGAFGKVASKLELLISKDEVKK